MVELRKRPAPKEAPAPAAKRSASKPRANTTSTAKKVVEKAKEVVTGETSATGAAAAAAAAAAPTKEPATEPAPAVETAATTTEASNPKSTTTTSATADTPLSDASVNKKLDTASIQTPTLTHDGTTSTLQSLLSSSTTGIVIFTYPKASTPGCTTQACLFRDNYDDIRAKGYTVYGLSNDSEKANTGFKTKQNLQYAMLCDPDAKLTGVLGMKKPGNAKGTLRGVVVLGNDGDVQVWFQGGPAKTVDTVKEFLKL